MRRRGKTLTLAALCLLSLAALLPSAASAAPASAWTLVATAEPANFAPGLGGEYVVLATAGGASEVELTVPVGLPILTFSAQNSTPEAATPSCKRQSRFVTGVVAFAVLSRPSKASQGMGLLPGLRANWGSRGILA